MQNDYVEILQIAVDSLSRSVSFSFKRASLHIFPFEAPPLSVSPLQIETPGSGKLRQKTIDRKIPFRNDAKGWPAGNLLKLLAEKKWTRHCERRDIYIYIYKYIYTCVCARTYDAIERTRAI